MKEGDKPIDGWCSECGKRRGELTPSWDCDCHIELPLTKEEIADNFERNGRYKIEDYLDKRGLQLVVKHLD